jgi:hypothetical protein
MKQQHEPQSNLPGLAKPPPADTLEVHDRDLQGILAQVAAQGRYVFRMDRLPGLIYRLTIMPLPPPAPQPPLPT